MSALVAIPTRYKGHTFRSRLEARWAGFFTLMGVSWEYEPEGFVLPSGRQYLPDFRLTFPRPGRLPGIVWCEVKPEGVTSEPKFDEFARVVEQGNYSKCTCATSSMFLEDSDDDDDGSGEEDFVFCAACASPEPEEAYAEARLLAGDPLSYYGATEFPWRFVCPGCLGRHDSNYGMVGDTFRYECDFCDFSTPFGCEDYPLRLEVKESVSYYAGPCAVFSHKGGMRTMKIEMEMFCNCLLEHAQKARAARFGV